MNTQVKSVPDRWSTAPRVDIAKGLIQTSNGEQEWHKFVLDLDRAVDKKSRKWAQKPLYSSTHSTYLQSILLYDLTMTGWL